MSEVRTKHLQSITEEIRSLRGWLDYLEKDLARDAAGERGVISGVMLASIGESTTNLIYKAGILNGATLNDSERS